MGHGTANATGPPADPPPPTHTQTLHTDSEDFRVMGRAEESSESVQGLCVGGSAGGPVALGSPWAQRGVYPCWGENGGCGADVCVCGRAHTQVCGARCPSRPLTLDPGAGPRSPAAASPAVAGFRHRRGSAGSPSGTSSGPMATESPAASPGPAGSAGSARPASEAEASPWSGPRAAASRRRRYACTAAAAAAAPKEVIALETI
jgi:hypothetical protein